MTGLIATQAQLESYLGRGAGTLNPLTASRVLSSASSKIEAFLGFDPTLQDEEIIVRVQPGATRMWLPVPQVTAVALLEMRSFGNNWQAVDSDAYAWDPDGTIEFWGFVPYGSQSAHTPVAMRITYTRGWSPLPAGMVNVCLEMASATIAVPVGGVTQQRIGNWREDYDPKAAELSDTQRAVLNRFRQPAL